MSVVGRWGVRFYEGPDEGCPVRDFLEALEQPQQNKLLALIRLLEEQGPALPFPYSSQIRGKLRELRTHYGRTQYRVLYCGASGRMFVLLHAFVKRTAETPRRDIEIAERRMAAYQRHLTRKGRTP